KPKAKGRGWQMKGTKWSGRESFKPSAWRRVSRSSKLVSSPTIWLIGSPTKRNSANAIKATTSMTSTASSARRITKASIADLAHRQRRWVAGTKLQPARSPLEGEGWGGGCLFENQIPPSRLAHQAREATSPSRGEVTGARLETCA